MKLNRIYSMINRKEVLLVDCFDTIIFRRCDPQTVVHRWINLVSYEYGVKYDICEKIWKQVLKCVKKIYCEKRQEETFEYLCKEFYSRICGFLNNNCSFTEFYKNVYEHMLKIELSVQFLNDEVLEMLKYASSKKMKVIVVSDFYLPREALLIFFQNLHIDLLIDEIFVSSDIGRRKSSGSLYDYILNEMMIQPEKCIMLGDNKKSDYVMPKSRGIDSILYNTNDEHIYTAEVQVFFDEVLKKYDYSSNSFIEYAFSLYIFCENLYNRNIGRTSKIYFFAREGEYLKKIFDNYMDINELKKIETVYIYVSRQSTYLPSLNDIDLESFYINGNDFKNISVDNFLDNLCFSKEEKEYVLQKYDGDCNRIIYEFCNSNELSNLKENKFFREIYCKKLVEAKENAREYFNSKDIKFNSSIVIVDIGWKGSIQDYLYRIFDGQICIKGYYYGLLGAVQVEKMNEKEGLIFFDWPYESKEYNLYSVNYRILERLLCASHGSCISYQNGEPVLNEISAKEKALLGYVGKIQDDMLKMHVDIAKYRKEYYIKEKEFKKVAMKYHLKYLFEIDSRRIQQMKFMNERHDMNFGDWGNTKVKKDIIHLLRTIKLMPRIEKNYKILYVATKYRIMPIRYFIKKNYLSYM